ncbi:hypothetical protein ERJ75_001103100 [Trypanosoma vivax]|nr:hypothetical protein ERJ75_001103100 [Trypanosoma vivax]
MLADKRQEEYGVNGNDTEEKRRPALGVVEVEQQGKSRNEVTCGVETGEGSEHQRGEGPDLRSDTNPAPGCDCVFRFFALCGFTIGQRFFACKGEQAKLGEEHGREVLGRRRRSAGREWVASVAEQAIDSGSDRAKSIWGEGGKTERREWTKEDGFGLAKAWTAIGLRKRTANGATTALGV